MKYSILNHSLPETLDTLSSIKPVTEKGEHKLQGVPLPLAEPCYLFELVI